MLKKVLLSVLLVAMLSAMSACNLVEDLLGQVSDIIENENQNNVTENNVNEADNSNEAEVEAEEIVNNAEDDEAESEEEGDLEVTPINDSVYFDEKLKADGYNNLILPNGYELNIPYQFILVGENLAEADAETPYTTTFCYDLPFMEKHEVAAWVKSQNETEGESSSASMGEDIYEMMFHTTFGSKVTMTFEKDDYDNDCVDLVIEHEESGMEDESGEWTGPGEDPSTMVSEEELAEMEAYQNEQAEDEAEVVDIGIGDATLRDLIEESRERSLPDNYDEDIQKLSDDINYFGLADDVSVQSITETLTASPDLFEFITHGVPHIIPYEWYTMEFEDEGNGWRANFCTDTSLSEAMVKHNKMLEAMNADVMALEIYDTGDDGKYGYNTFQLNDVFGTGSWVGETIFYVENGSNNTPIDNHKCIEMKMEFSPEILN